MAYAAVVSLMQVLEQLLGPDQVPIRCPKSQIKLLSDKVSSLKAFLNNESPEYKWSKTKNSLEKEIRDAIWRAEDVVESSLSSYFLSSGSENPEDESDTSVLSEDLQKVIQEVESITKKTVKFTDDVMRGRIFPDITTMAPSYLGSSGPGPMSKNKIVGFDKYLEDLKHQLIEENEMTTLGALPIIGMSGIGKTALATCFYNDPLTMEHFDIRVWAAASHVFYKRDILLNLLDSMKVLDDEMRKKSDAQLEEHITSNLKGKRYLIVLDNVSDTITWMDFVTLFPFEKKGSKIIVTTTIRNVAERVIKDTEVDYKCHKIHEIDFLNESDSWHLFCEAVFAEEPCPPELQKSGKKIAKNCGGLPLAIITTGRHLATSEKSPEYWKNVAESGISFIADTEDAAGMRKQLSLGYKLLPQHLKACFLSLAVFSQNYEMPAPKLIKFWVSEGFLEPMKDQTFEAVAEHCLKELVDRSLILVRKMSSSAGIKTCTVHSAMWTVCSKKAKKNKFLCVIKKSADCSFPEGANSQRRLSILNNVVFGIRDAHDSMDSLSTVRSLLCVGPHHPYPSRVCLGFKLLRILDTLTIRFYKFPDEILVLFMLRYLALTHSGGELPAGLSKLRNLQFLIVRLHESVKFSAAPSYLPMEIWTMKELRHLQVMGSDLPDPDRDELPNLHTLLDVSPYSCTKKVFKNITKLRKLGIRIVLTHQDDAGEPFHPFDHLYVLHNLESLKCVVVNPTFESQVIYLPNSVSFFPNWLKKLTLSGCGFPWEDMRKIAQLQYVEVLKLRTHAFRGRMWTTENEGLRNIQYLLLEDLDLVQWRAKDKAFKKLKHVCIRHCYNLEVLPSRFAWTEDLALIELFDCKPSTVDSAKKLEGKRLSILRKNHPVKVKGYFSWQDEKPIRPSQEFSII
ncbi:hypothetical protein BUALT_Bualt17G0076700 [Buddleja alternifolia]|uniref:NB-ARC domain-containing protein n=1 Tax=Buddleja alternifolia TaxID=168488 RepID=A0AAV6WF90_9LAMI|nr:hypothetical protein BUALT_Bualt17G0076700 [Buddleja alternifolia]